MQSIAVLLMVLTSQCESHAPVHDGRLDVRCPLTPSGKPTTYRFKVHFAGSHDDTTASIEAALNEQPIVCAEGSKTQTQFEDGDVTLDCAFSPDAAAAAPQVLSVAIKWHHAQVGACELLAE